MPNILTVVRLLAAPGVAIAFLVLARPWADWVALVLFVGAALTDWLDGKLARDWQQESKFGAMLDPIADKAMVIIALAVLCGLFGLSVLITLPIVVILFRETFVSGLREYLGDTAGTLKVTRLAKWKTTVQMVAISLLLASGLFQHYFGMWSYGMDPTMVGQILNGDLPDNLGLVRMYQAWTVSTWAGFVLLWVAAALTLITGIDYFRKALPHLGEEP